MEDLSVIRTVKSIVDQTQSDQKNILETVQEMCGHQFVIAKEIGQKVPNDSKLQEEMSQLLTLVRAVQSSTDASNMFVKNKISAILALVKEALNKVNRMAHASRLGQFSNFPVSYFFMVFI